jgi:hypothetical protein
MVTRAVPIAFAFAVGMALAGCSSGLSAQTIQTSVSNGAAQASASGVHCAREGQSVTVTGTLTSHLTANEPPGLRASIYNSDHHRIGRLVRAMVLSPGESQAFSIVIRTDGMPKSCVVGGTVVGGSDTPGH